MNNRILELALESLQVRRSAIEAEITQIRTELEGSPRLVERPAKAAPAGKKRRARTRAERKAQSERMKLYWAKRRAEVPRNAAAKANSARKSKA